MKQETKTRIQTLYRIVLSAVLVVCGLLLMAACLQIYLSGGQQIYTPQKVAVAFGRIALPVYICLGMLVVSILLELILWQPAKTSKTKQPGMQLRRLMLTRDPQQADSEKQAALRRLRGGRLAMGWGCALTGILCSGIFLFVALTNSVFYPEPAQATAYVVSLMPVFGPCAALALGAGILFAYLRRKNAEKQIVLYKQFPPLPQAKATGKPIAISVIRYCVLVLSLGLMVWGLTTGGWQDVLTKAVNICTECVGLG